jgi:hypothetical protein
MSISSGIRASRLVRRLIGGVTLGAIGLLVLLPGLASAAPPPPPPDAPGIEVTDGSVPFLLWHAIGTQNYVCAPSGDGFAWAFAGPSATLYDDKGKQVGVHFAGPTWQAQDGSSVVATVAASAAAPGTIAWLRLEAAWTTFGPEGGDRLSATTNIQRVNTTGGVRPEAGCDEDSLGDQMNVPYTADYYFYRLKE